MKIARLSTQQADFDAQLTTLTSWDDSHDDSIRETVAGIIRKVRQQGDAALIELTNRFDRTQVASIDELILERDQLLAAVERIPAELRTSLQEASSRIRDYHQHQLQESWQYRDADGSLLGQQITPLDRAGLYAPGGKAAYPSSVLMNVVPAQVAGVGEVVMMSPAPGGELNDAVLAAAAIAGVDRLYSIGGAQAIAALAYGTESVPAVDKITGPGNSFVAEAKRQVFGKVGIDMIAGPSEILVVCDGHTDPEWIAADLFSQAEHDEEAQAILISQDADFIERVAAVMSELVGKLERASIIEQSVANRCALIQVSDLNEAIELVNRIAPEHLELSIEQAEDWAKKVRHAGAIFLGRHTSEALGDYCAGPNHVLPTSATARFSSPLGVYDFQKRSSLIGCSPAAASRLGKIAGLLADSEGLTAHALSARLRISDN